MKRDAWIVIGMVTAVSVSVLTMLGNFLLWADFQSMEGLVPSMEATAPVVVTGLVASIFITATGYSSRQQTSLLGVTFVALTFISAFAVNWLEVGGLGGLDIVFYGMAFVIVTQVGGFFLEDPDMMELHI